MPLTLAEVAAILNVSLRQAQRYAAHGYRGHRLVTTKAGHQHVVEAADFERWLLATGLGQDNTPVPEESSAESADRPEPEPEAPSATRPEHIKPSDPNAPLTNCPSAHSSNFCSPEAMRKHTEQAARDLVQSYGGTPSYDI